MLPSLRRTLFLFVFFFGGGFSSQAGTTSYTDRGKADFDTAIQLLNPYGTWSKIDGKWAYTPLDHEAPYTDGRWIYTEYGWYWKGRLPHSWATEHYGYWKRDASRVWSWYPGPYWLPQIVEIRSTSMDIGWRSGEVDDDGNFVEEAADRFAKTDEWTFVTLAQFANPITPSMVERPDQAKSALEDSVESRHTYVTYREIDRPGPHPADFVALCRDGGMFAPLTLQDRLAAQTAMAKPSIYASSSPVNTTMTGTNAPTLLGTDIDPAADKRHVKYWITMSLPTFWTQLPPEAKPEEIYLYRPDFYQDEDGIARRIALWLDPSRRSMAKQSLSEILGGSAVTPAAGGSTKATPALPAVPAQPAPSRSAFQSPFDDSFSHGGGLHSSASSSKSTVPEAPTNAPDAPIPLPMATNAAPAGRN